MYGSILRLAFLLLFCIFALADHASDAILNTSVSHFSSHDKNAAEVFRDLAHNVGVSIAISGYIPLMRAHDKSISVDADGKPLHEVLDSICAKDQNYRWRSFDGGGIRVELGSHPLSLIDVEVTNVVLRNAKPNEAIAFLLDTQAVKSWKRATGCQVGSLFQVNGQPPIDNGWRANLDLHDKPLWEILNEFSSLSKTFYWSAIGSSAGDCHIFLSVFDNNT